MAIHSEAVIRLQRNVQKLLIHLNSCELLNTLCRNNPSLESKLLSKFSLGQALYSSIRNQTQSVCCPFMTSLLKNNSKTSGRSITGLLYFVFYVNSGVSSIKPH